MTSTEKINTFATLAAYLRANGIPAIAGSTGGNCNAVIVYLTDMDEVLINDAVGGPLLSVDEEVDAWWVTLYLLDKDEIDQGEFAIGDHAALLQHLRTEFDDMFDWSRIDTTALPVTTAPVTDAPTAGLDALTVTITATGNVPLGTDVDGLTEALRAVMVEHGITLIPCDFTPDRDTVADAAGIAYAQMVVVDVNAEVTAEAVRFADEALDAIRDDMLAGRIPSTVSTFSDLHDHVDGNDYLIPAWESLDYAEDPFSLPLLNYVSTRVDNALPLTFGDLTTEQAEILVIADVRESYPNMTDEQALRHAADTIAEDMIDDDGTITARAYAMLMAAAEPVTSNYLAFTDNGRQWAVTWVPSKRAGDPIVTFWDLTHAMREVPGSNGQRGQHVSEYFYSDLAGWHGPQGLNLDGGVPEWSVASASVYNVLRAITPAQRGI